MTVSEQKDFMLIHKKKCVKLHACLKALKKDQLRFLSHRLRLDRKLDIESAKSDELVMAAEKEILERLPYIFRYMGAGTYIHLSKIEGTSNSFFKSMSEAFISACYGKDVKYNEDLAVEAAIHNGLLFFFQEKAGEKIIAVVPDEVRRGMGPYNMNMLVGQDCLPGDLVYFRYYAEVLTHLYGVCFPEQLMKIYNRDYSEDARNDKSEVLKFMREIANTSEVLGFKDGYLFLEEFDHESQIKRILANRKGFEPYLPTKEEIEERISQNEYDANLPSVKKLESFLTSFDEDSGYFAARLVLRFIKMEFEESDFIGYLSDDFGIKFNETQKKEFSEICHKIWNSCHFYTRLGNTANEKTSGRTKDAEAQSNIFGIDL